MANEILPPNSPFTRAVQQVKAKRRADEPEESEGTRRASPRARLNFIPDDTLLAEMIDRALYAVSKGTRWARGAILNLLV